MNTIPQKPLTIFQKAKIGSLTLGNRVIRSAAFENMSPNGEPSEDLIQYHRQLAAGGVGMTTVAYASVSKNGLTYPHQINLQKRGIQKQLRRLTDEVHKEGVAVSLQIGHAGYFSNKKVTKTRPLGASKTFNTYGLTFSKKMTEEDFLNIGNESL